MLEYVKYMGHNIFWIILEIKLTYVYNDLQELLLYLFLIYFYTYLFMYYY